MHAKPLLAWFIIALLLSALAAILYGVLINGQMNLGKKDTASFEECVAAGNPVMESFPRQCRSAEGVLFVEDVPFDPAPPVSSPAPAGGCARAGCSAQLCVEAEKAASIITTCEFRPEYACYDNATCERQPTGECGWTQTNELQQCLQTSNRPQADVF